MLNESDITLAVLAGGAGSRMGMPKANLRVGDRPLLNYLLDQWQWAGPTLLVSAPGREHPPGAEAFDREAVDAVAEEGPLRGILTALQASGTSVIIVTTVDMPKVGREQLQWFCKTFARLPASAGIVLKRNGHVAPFPCLLKTSLADPIAQTLQAGDRRAQSVASLEKVSTLPPPVKWDAGVWINLNFPADFQAFVESMR